MLIHDGGISWEWKPGDQRTVMGRSTSQYAGCMIERFHLDLSPEEVEEKNITNMVKFCRGRVPFLPDATRIVSLAADSKRFRSGLASGSPWLLIENVT